MPKDSSEDSIDQLLEESDKATAIECNLNIWVKFSVRFLLDFTLQGKEIRVFFQNFIVS